MLINNYIPMFGISIAFKKLNFREGIWGSPWVGFKNFKFLFASADAWIITRNTILYNVAFFIVGNALAITIAILINEIQSRVAKKAYQSLILLPYLMSWVIVSYLAYTFLSAETGMFNKEHSGTAGTWGGQLVSGEKILAFYSDFRLCLEERGLQHDHLPFQRCRHQHGLL
ncbi:MAG: hypothetical protein ACLR2E_21465 [Lachnospiraceae bacterium]